MKRSRRGKVARDLVQRAVNSDWWNSRLWTVRSFNSKAKARALGLPSNWFDSGDYMFSDIREQMRKNNSVTGVDYGKIEMNALAVFQRAQLEGGMRVGDWSVLGALPSNSEVTGKSNIALRFLQRAPSYAEHWRDPKTIADYLSRVSDLPWEDGDSIKALIEKLKKDAPRIHIKPKPTEEELNYLSDGIDLAENAKRFAEGVARFSESLKTLKIGKARPESGSVAVGEDLDNRTVIEIDSVPDCLKTKD